MKLIRPPFKIHGGKFYLSEFVVDHFPENYEKLDYLEPFLGAGSVFLNKKDGEKSQVINDLHRKIFLIFTALRDEPKEFIKRIKKVEYEKGVFEKELARTEFKDYMDEAVNEYILRRMSRDGLKKDFAWSDRKRGGKPGDVNAWETIIEVLPTISKKLQNVTLFNKPAIQVISAFDNPNTLCYCDPHTCQKPE